MKRIMLLIALALTGCASNSGVVARGADEYFLSRQAATGAPGLGSLKADAYTEANQFCGTKGLVAQVFQEQESKPPFVLGNYPRVEIQFKCITKESRPPLSSFYTK